MELIEIGVAATFPSHMKLLQDRQDASNAYEEAKNKIVRLLSELHIYLEQLKRR